MPSPVIPQNRLVADVGGTNTRLALYDPNANEFRGRCDYLNTDYPRFEDIIAHWLNALNEPPPVEACLAIAAPPFDDRVSMININWTFSLRELADRFALSQLRCINDFEGNAYSLLHLRETDLATLHAGAPGGGKLATMGPGTGLGGSTLQLVAGVPVATACEPGHMGLAAATELELAIFGHLLPRFGEAYAELLLSGPGLLRLYQTLCEILGRTAEELTPRQISSLAVAGDCDLCSTTLETFCALLGSISGDFVLANGAYGGLYLTGGILPGIIPFLQSSPFCKRFQEKGAMSEHLGAVPVLIITADTPALLGAAHAPL